MCTPTDSPPPNSFLPPTSDLPLLSTTLNTGSPSFFSLTSGREDGSQAASASQLRRRLQHRPQLRPDQHSCLSHHPVHLPSARLRKPSIVVKHSQALLSARPQPLCCCSCREWRIFPCRERESTSLVPTAIPELPVPAVESHRSSALIPAASSSGRL